MARFFAVGVLGAVIGAGLTLGAVSTTGMINGPSGPVGPAGPVGAQGAKGDAGEPGKAADLGNAQLIVDGLCPSGTTDWGTLRVQTGDGLAAFASYKDLSVCRVKSY
ncbi:hypothetical protein HHL19_12800 [Streptomyces sp. R302]|uniref:hypothetical protein n=1 Tax=unclassified Streptomyces TaxID=2593676 RepID=UPI00145D0A2E|nr:MULTISPECIES: hypothetical protein [unclassified Streptomyces]NML50539.1 hypothetical protein [Streptomyces sp. R301]NML79530.1 hypothetical protein [Streptomyces sp. R302]